MKGQKKAATPAVLRIIESSAATSLLRGSWSCARYSAGVAAFFWPFMIRSAYHGGELFVLIAGNQGHARGDRGLPAQHHGFMAAEVVAFAPALVFAGREAIEGVETDPVAELVRVIDQSTQTTIVFSRPVAGLMMPALVHLPPRVVPPAPVIGGRLGQELFGRHGREQAIVLRFGIRRDRGSVRRSEQPQAGAHGHLVEEDFFLRVGIFGEHEQRLRLERRELVRIGWFLI